MPEAEREWVETKLKEGAARRPSVAGFTVYDRSDLAPVGTTALMGIDHRDRTAEFGISVGDRRGRGLGTDAARLTLDWAFTVLSLHNVVLRALDWNQQALASVRRAGFRELGRRREAVLSGGRLCDEVSMDVLASEFTGSVLAPARDRRAGRAPPVPRATDGSALGARRDGGVGVVGEHAVDAEAKNAGTRRTRCRRRSGRSRGAAAAGTGSRCGTCRRAR